MYIKYMLLGNFLTIIHNTPQGDHQENCMQECLEF